MAMNPALNKNWLAALRSGAYNDLFLVPPEEADLERWLSYVEVSGECWEWTGGLNGDGYPYTNLRSQILRGNRLFWILENRTLIPSNKVVCHSCDNRKCVRPSHLWLGSLTDNNRDRANKGRSRDQRGTRNSQAKLTDDKAAEIRRRYSTGEYFQRQIASDFGITQTMVGRIVRGEAWNHMEQL